MTFAISRYLSIQQAYFPSFQSDGEGLAFLSNLTGIPQVWRLRLNPSSERAEWPDQLTFETDRVMGVWTSPAQGDRRLIYARDLGGNERAQLYLFHPDTGQEQQLTAGHEAATHLFGDWSPEGDRILFAANRRDPARFDLHLQPLDGEAQLVWENDQPGYLVNLTFSPGGERAAAVRAASSQRHDLFEVDLKDGSTRQLNPPELEARFEALSYSADGHTLFLNTDLGSDFLHVSRLDLETHTFSTSLSPKWDIEALTRSPDGRLLAYTVNLDGAYELHLLDLENNSNRLAPLPEDTPGVVAMWDARMCFSPDSSQLAFSFTSAVRPSELYLWRLEENRVDRVTRCSYGAIPASHFTSPRLVRYPTFDGRKIPAWFYMPKPEQERPAACIVYIHGGPTSQFKPYFHFFIQYFVDQGYAVFAPNVRGSTGYGKEYSQLDDVERRMDSVEDLAHAARWLQEQPEIDGSRLVAYGGSYGGFMVLSALASEPELWAAGIDIVGISNFVTFLENTSDYRREHREAEYGSLNTHRSFLHRISPLNNVDQINAPLMVIHGANDPRVPLSEAEQIAQALEGRGVPVELLVFEDEGHGLVKLENKRVAYPAIARFLEEHLADTRAST